MSQAVTCPPNCNARRRLKTAYFAAELEAGKLYIPIAKVFTLTRPGAELESIVFVLFVADFQDMLLKKTANNKN